MKGPNPVKSIVIKTYSAVTSMLFRLSRDDAQSGDSADRRMKRRGGVNLCRTSGQTLHGEFAEKELAQEKKKMPFHANTQSGHNPCVCVRVGRGGVERSSLSLGSYRAVMDKASVDIA